MIKLLLLTLGAASLTASATAVVTKNTPKLKAKIEPVHEEPKNPVVKIIDEPRRNSFVTDRFKQLVEENKLTGFVFKEVWDSWTGDGR